MGRTHIIHRENCTNCIRQFITDELGRTIVLSGMYAFEWTVAIITEDNMTISKFKNRESATKEFKKYKKRK